MCSIAGVFHSDLVTVEYQACGCDLPNSLQLDSALVPWEIPTLNGGLDREIPKKSSPTGGFPWEKYQ